MTYWLLNLPFLGAVAVVCIAAVVTRRAPRWRAVGLAAVVILVLTAVFDNALVATGIVGYNPALFSGVRVGVAPLEDFAYALAALILLPALWNLSGGHPKTQENLTTRRRRGCDTPTPHSGFLSFDEETRRKGHA